ncbi:hypothetical protein PG984_016244 [Apiospora sp. TS-2023a]
MSSISIPIRMSYSSFLICSSVTASSSSPVLCRRSASIASRFFSSRSDERRARGVAGDPARAPSRFPSRAALAQSGPPRGGRTPPGRGSLGPSAPAAHLRLEYISLLLLLFGSVVVNYTIIRRSFLPDLDVIHVILAIYRQHPAEIVDLALEQLDKVPLAVIHLEQLDNVHLSVWHLELYLEVLLPQRVELVDRRIEHLSQDLGLPTVDGVLEVEGLFVHPLQQPMQGLSGRLQRGRPGRRIVVVVVEGGGGGRLDAKVGQAPSGCDGTGFLVVGVGGGEVLVLVGLAKPQRLGHQRRRLLGVPVVVEVVEGSVTVNIVGVEVRGTVNVIVVGGLVLDENVPINILV